MAETLAIAMLVAMTGAMATARLLAVTELILVMVVVII